MGLGKQNKQKENIYSTQSISSAQPRLIFSPSCVSALIGVHLKVNVPGNFLYTPPESYSLSDIVISVTAMIISFIIYYNNCICICTHCLL